MQQNSQDENIVSGLYDNYQETQKEILEIELRKTRTKLFTLSAVVFGSDLLALVSTDTLNISTLIVILVIPALLLGLGFLAGKEPLLSMIIAAVVIAGIWVYAAIVTGGMAAISGWLIKAIIVYLVIAGFQSAVEAQKIKKELKG
ncbi:MAG: hypothetical protein HYZ15_12570 [Sphingobacteriales bacterium]|nr:hypothetical protein [Sphingobacteriales bacterium]